MGYYSIAIPRENAWEVMNELGELSDIQFVDLHEHEQILNRPYALYIKRLEEMELKLQTIEQILSRFNKEFDRCTEYKAYLKSQREILKKRKENGSESEYTYINDVEADLDKTLQALNDNIKYFDVSVEKHNELVENIHVLEEAQVYFADDIDNSPEIKPDENKTPDAELGDAAGTRAVKFQYLAGVIDRDDSQRFRRVLFRATLGMVWSNLIDIEPAAPKKGEKNHHHFIANSKNETKLKTVFLIAYPRGEKGILEQKLNRIVDSFGAHKFGIPLDKHSFVKRLEELKSRRSDEAKLLQVTRENIDMLLENLSNHESHNGTWPKVEEFRLFIRKEKCMYHNLNMLRERERFLEGYFWCPLECEEEVKKCLIDLPKSKPNVAQPEVTFVEKPERAKPPTYFRTNDFTAPFQQIVNTYGIPRYQEVNPGLFTIASFPFLFGVMFGDIGHGLLVFAFGLYLCLNKTNIEKGKGLLAGLLYGRYLLTMMGFFALYCGFLYNDFMALPLNIFGTCYGPGGPNGALQKTTPNCVYAFGIDPAWYGTQNELTFLNSFKMKMAIIIGVCQMMLGVFLKAVNAVHFRSAIDFFFEWIPQLLFLSCTFGYMVILIFIKWSVPYGTDIPTSQSPAIINIFINFALKFGAFDVGTAAAPITPLYGNADGSTESAVQKALLIIALLSCPMMLIPKPLILILTSKSHAKAGHSEHKDDSHDKAQKDKKDKEGDEEKKGLLADEGKDEDKGEGKGDSKDETKTAVKDEVKDAKKEGEDAAVEITTDKKKDLDEKKVPEDAKKQPESEADHEEGGHGESPGDLIVHQLIETIEFVLGSISHTASYLRLWALSLAHSQLAAVFFTYTIGSAIAGGDFFMTFIGYALFAMITFGVLLCMDLLECFLHALRLHWVEFNSKFFKADGKDFIPFSFADAMNPDKKA